MGRHHATVKSSKKLGQNDLEFNMFARSVARIQDENVLRRLNDFIASLPSDTAEALECIEKSMKNRKRFYSD